MGFLCVLEIHLHFPRNGSLKGKRKELSSVKTDLARRFGAAVAETNHHELWQRATLSAALVGPQAREVAETASRLERFLDAQFPQGVRVERGVISIEEVLG